jgi:hypothetical protein
MAQRSNSVRRGAPKTLAKFREAWTRNFSSRRLRAGGRASWDGALPDGWLYPSLVR